MSSEAVSLDLEPQKREMVLEYVENPDMTQGEVAGEHGYSGGHLSNILTDLESEGVVEKDGHTYDLNTDREVFVPDNDDIYENLTDDQEIILFGAIVDATYSEIAEHTDNISTDPSVGHQLDNLVEDDYLRKVGRGEYIPGNKLISNWETYEPEIELFSGLDPSRPLENTEEEMRWLIGESLYEIINESSIESIEVSEESAENEDSVDDLEIDLNNHSKVSAVSFLEMIKNGEEGFGIISSQMSNAHELSQILEDEGLIDEDKDSAAGLKITETGERYLEKTEINERGPESDRKQQSTRNRRTTRSRSSKTEGKTSVDSNLQELGDRLLAGHEETIEQHDDQKRDFTDNDNDDFEFDEDSEDLDITDNAGYEGFT